MRQADCKIPAGRRHIAAWLLSVALLLCVNISHAGAVTVITKTIKPSGGDYTSLAAWEAGRQGDLVAADTIEVAECYAAIKDTSRVIIDGWTTGANNYIKIYTPASERHDGKWHTSKYQIKWDTFSADLIYINEDYVRIDGLQLDVTNYAGIRMGAVTGEIHISNTIAKGNPSATTNNKGFELAVRSPGVLKMWNSIAYDFKNATGTNIGFQVYDTGSIYIYNCTAYNCELGFYALFASSPYVYNNIANACTDGFAVNASTWIGNYNISDLPDDAPGANSKNSTTVSFVDAANKDFHLSASDTAAKDSGQTNPASGLYSDDIDGQTRTGTWDIGADEYVAAGAPVPAFMHHYERMRR